MSTGFSIYIVLQFIASIALIYGYAHEKQVIAFEDRVWSRFRSNRRQKQKNDTPLVEVHTQQEQIKKEAHHFSTGEMAGWSYFDEVA